MLVSDILTTTAPAQGGEPAVWYRGEWRSYRELEEAASRFAGFLAGAGVAGGDRVAIAFENSFDYVIAHFGVLLAGAVDVSLDPALRPKDLAALLADCGAVALIASARQVSGLQKLEGELPELKFVVVDRAGSPTASNRPTHILAEVLDHAPIDRRCPKRGESDLASIVYTSGSTGKSKGVALTHRNITTNTRAIVDYLGLGSSDKMMVVLPFHYIYGRSLLYTHLLSGGSLVIDNRFQYPSAIVQTMEDQGVTCFAGVPSTFSILLRKTDLASRSMPQLRLVTQAGGAMSPAIQREVRDTFAPARLFVMYGCTEAAPRLTYLPPEMLDEKSGSIGQPIAGVEIKVVGAEGKRMPAHAVGELVARGPNIMEGYWNDAPATAEVLKDGWYWTGDLGYEDADGFFYITGRAREIIKSGGYRIGIREIEDELMEISGIEEAAVVGVPDDVLGEAAHAYLVSSDGGIGEQAIRAHLRSRLPLYKLPKTMVFIDELPKNAAGKTDKARLRERDREGVERVQ